MKLIIFFLCLCASLLAEEKSFVKADAAHFNGNDLVLEGHVLISMPLGVIRSSKALLHRDQEDLEEKYSFPFLELEEEVTLTLVEGGVLRCHQAELNHVEHVVYLTGKERLYYSDEKRGLYAKRARVEYVEREKERFEVTKLTLEDEVEMAATEGGHVQYALAHRVHYFPEQEELILEGREDLPVLFVDPAKDLHISALKVLAKKEAGKEMIWGEGNVRFAFQQEEIDRIKGKFTWR